jgi:hypothetical protein
MKKVLCLIGAAVMLMALATPVMAQFKSWGHIEVHTVYYQNKFNSFNTNTSLPKDQTERFIAERSRIYLQYGDPKVARAVLGFEMDASRWGTTAGGRNNMGQLNTDQVAVEIKWAFLEFVIPQTPLTMMLGMNWWDTGISINGGSFFAQHDAPGISLTANFAPHSIMAFMYREEDDSTTNYQVSDMYGLEYNLKQKVFDLNAWFAYQNDLRTDYADQPWWVGLAGGFRPGNFDFKVNAAYVGGTRQSAAGDIDYGGYAAELAARYRIGPGMFAGVWGFYSTGNDADETTKDKRYRMARGSEGYSGFGNWRSVYFYKASGVFGPNYDAYQGDFSANWPWGTYCGNVNFEYSPTAYLRFVANYLYYGDTAKGTPGAGKIVNTPRGARQDKDEDSIGSEVNLIGSLMIAKGFMFNAGVGYFIPGAVFDTPSNSADNSYNILTRIVYTF